MTRWRTWREAATAALYGPGGFYRRPEGPAGHFRTSAHAGDLFAAALASLARDAGLHTLVDVGSGRGELAASMARVAADVDVIGVEVGDRDSATEVPDGVEALVVANEWLDNVPVDVVLRAADGPRVVEVDDGGAQRPGPAPAAADLSWLERWWPLHEVGARAEVGRPRDEAWAALVRRISRGIAVAVDYGHTKERRPPGGTLTGFRHGRAVPPVPDGTTDITAHVAMDACAAAAEAAGPSWTLLTSQRDALHALGVDGRLPPAALAAADPAGYLQAVASASEAAELVDSSGLGGFTWLIHGVHIELPARLGDCAG